MVQVIHRPPREEDIPLRVDVVAHAPEDLARVVDAVVDRNFGEVGDDETAQLAASIRADEEMVHHGVSSKLNADWTFLTHLRDKGHRAHLHHRRSSR